MNTHNESEGNVSMKHRESHHTYAQKNVVITGAMGYLGRKLIQKLTAKTETNIIAIDKIEADFSHPKIHSIKCDLSKIEGEESIRSLGETLQNATIFHLAGLFVKDISLSLRVSPEEYERDNLLATRQLVNGLLKSGYHPKLLVFSSTACVYDGSKTRPTPVELALPIVPYAESKFDAEKELSKLDGWIERVVVLRLSRVIGLGDGLILPRDIVSDFIERFVLADLSHIQCTIGSSLEVRPYINIEDLISIFLCLMTDYEKKGIVIKNVTSVTPIQVKDIAMIVAKTMEEQRMLSHEPLLRPISKVRTRVPILNPLPYEGFQPRNTVSADVIRTVTYEYCRMLKKLVKHGMYSDLLSAIETTRE